MRSTGVAYLLWLFTLIGFAGIHRFYAGKWITGILWLFTWGPPASARSSTFS